MVKNQEAILVKKAAPVVMKAVQVEMATTAEVIIPAVTKEVEMKATAIMVALVVAETEAAKK